MTEFGKRIKIPDYTPEQQELWIDRTCPAYTGIMAAINGIAHRRFGCFVDKLSSVERDVVDAEASGIGLAWFEMPSEEKEAPHDLRRMSS